MVRSKALQRAAEIIGGTEKLSRLLGIPLATLERWISGQEEPPTHVFLEAVDILAGGRPYSAAQRAREARRNAAAAVSRSILARERAAATIAAILAQHGEPPIAMRRNATALGFLQRRFEPTEGAQMAAAALDAAIHSAGAATGNLQILRPEGLIIGAQRGFDRKFLDFFACVRDEGSACGAAMRRGVRVIVPDVANDPIFADTEAGAVMLEANALAVQSTPLVAPSGELVGMLSTHYPEVHTPDARELDRLAHIARRTAFWLDGRKL